MSEQSWACHEHILTFFDCVLSCFSISEPHADSTSPEFFDSWSYDLDVDDESTRLVLSRHLQAGRINSISSHNHDIEQSHSQSFPEHIAFSMNHVIKVRTRDSLSVCRFQCVCSLPLSKQAARRTALLFDLHLFRISQKIISSCFYLITSKLSCLNRESCWYHWIFLRPRFTLTIARRYEVNALICTMSRSGSKSNLSRSLHLRFIHSVT